MMSFLAGMSGFCCDRVCPYCWKRRSSVSVVSGISGGSVYLLLSFGLNIFFGMLVMGLPGCWSVGV